MSDTSNQDPRPDSADPKPPQACQRMTNLLQPFVDDELTGSDREAVGEHLAECAHCRGEVQEQQQVRAALRSLDLEPASDELVARVRAALDGIDAENDGLVVLEERRSRLRAFTRGAGMMLPAAAAAVALFFVVRSDSGHDSAAVADAIPAAASPSTLPESRSAQQPLPQGVELVGGSEDSAGGAYHYADRRNGLEFRDETQPLAGQKAAGTRHLFRGRAYFLSHDGQGRPRVQFEHKGMLHTLVEVSAAVAGMPGAKAEPVGPDAPGFRRLVVFTHDLHGKG